MLKLRLKNFERTKMQINEKSLEGVNVEELCKSKQNAKYKYYKIFKKIDNFHY